jgi:hypothetical protein
MGYIRADVAGHAIPQAVGAFEEPFAEVYVEDGADDGAVRVSSQLEALELPWGWRPTYLPPVKKINSAPILFVRLICRGTIAAMGRTKMAMSAIKPITPTGIPS